MKSSPPASAAPHCIAFEGPKRIASGELDAVVKKILKLGNHGSVLIFDDATSEVIDVDWRGTPKEVLAWLQHRPRNAASSATPSTDDTHEPRGRGRPKLGVQAREVTLLPRHWDWLGSQPGGASVAIRRLVEEARRSHGGRDRKRRAQESAYRFMSAMAGNERGFEEASRALFAGDAEKFTAQTASWPKDVREHVRTLAEGAVE
jgi:hypothetical protein